MNASAAGWTVDQIDPANPAWAELLAHTPHLLFHEPVWARVVSEGFAGDAVCLLIQQDGQPRAGVLGFVFVKLGMQIGYFTFPYGGLIGPAPPDGILARLLLDFGRRHGITQLRILGCPGGGPVPSTGFVEQADQTQILDLQDLNPESLWAGYKPNIRRDIRRPGH